MKSYELFIHYKQGDDLGSILENSKDPVDALTKWSEALKEGTQVIDLVASKIKGTTIEVEADCHHIGFYSKTKKDIKVLEQLVKDGFLSCEEYEDDEC